MKNSNKFSKFCQEYNKDVRVIDPKFDKDSYVSIDLSVRNQLLRSIDVTSVSEMENYIQDYVRQRGGRIAYGGYLEQRNLYQRSKHFKRPEQPMEERNIHLGIDIWSSAGTSVHAALDGEVHSFANNRYVGDYGPTIILKHTFDELEFYTLYGHLSLSSIPNLELGQQFKTGEKIGELGDPGVNGDYAPHLHFQIILDIQGYFGDYPGVCSRQNVDFYIDNCPDPNLLLKLK